MKFDPIAMATKYANMSRALEVELGVKSDISNGRIPNDWYTHLKELDWDAKKFLEIVTEIVKENENAAITDEDEGTLWSQESSDGGSDTSEAGHGGQLAESESEGLSSGDI